ncbi:MAG: DUF3300 domain-containing protein [Methyloceanibacter sp.]
MRAVGLLLLVLVAVSPSVVFAQEAPAEEEAQPQLLDQGELDQLVAPIALYPDPLLSQVLIASTYPLEVVQAERWAAKNKDLKGDALNDALAKEDWDDSVKALAAVPDVLAMMNEDLDWTSKLGDAVLAQQADVMDAIQRLRALAQSNGKLESNEQQTVTVTEAAAELSAGEADQPVAEQAAQPIIVIEPTSPETVYVPYYQPAVVYGGWPYPDYPPYYFEPRPGYIFGGALASGIAWSAGFAIGNAIWGDGFDWRDDNIRVNVNRNVNINNKNVNASNWQHNSYHRRGVNYKNTELRNKYSKGDIADKRPDFRGRGDGLGDGLPGGGGLGEKKPDLGGKGPGGGLTDKKPGLGGNQGGGLIDKKPDLGGKRPDVGDMQAALKKKPDIKKPDLGKKPNVQRPGGNAFDGRDGAKAKDFSKRGQASAGNRSPSKIAPKPAAKKPAIKKPAAKKPAVKKPAARKPAAKKPSIKKGGGGGRGGGGGKRKR